MSSDARGRPTRGLDDRLMAVVRRTAERNQTLPGEPALAVELGVSRPALREALARLERSGLVSRRHGAGTIVNPGAFALDVRFDEQAEFTDVLAEAGFDPSLEVLERQVVRLSAADASVLDEPADTATLRTVKRWRADGRAVMVAIDVIPLPGDEPLDLDALGPDRGLFDLVHDLRGETVEWELAWPGAMSATAAISEWLELPARSAVMTLDLVGVNRSGRRCYRALEYHVPGAVRAGFVRSVRSS